MSIASYEYVLGFLPVVSGLVWVLTRLGCGRCVGGLLVIASLIFCAWASPRFVPFLVVTAIASFFLGLKLASAVDRQDDRSARRLLWGGVALNLLPLIYFRAGAASTLGMLRGGSVADAALPLGISFITFQQIAYIVDVYRGDPPLAHLLDYGLLVTFFPKLVAGPICRHRELFEALPAGGPRFRSSDGALGVTTFSIGLAKKILLADRLSPLVAAVFGGMAMGRTPSVGLAWAGVLAYTLQLYFDFSGYSDMAIGAGRLVGVSLPVNFNSPYKAASIADFWKRWHISLSTLFFEWIYFPIAVSGRSRPGVTQAGALLGTMLLCGLWHGTAWTFMAWGALHGLYLIVNYRWRAWRLASRAPVRLPPWRRAFAVGFTFLAVAIGWVFFRAENVESALRMLAVMAGLGGPVTLTPEASSAEGSRGVLLIAIGLVIVWGAPNTEQWLGGVAVDGGRHEGAAWWVWRPSAVWAIGTGLVLAISLFFLQSVRGEFLYFRF